MTHLFAIVAIVLYILASVLMLVQLWRHTEGGRVSTVARATFYAALSAHTVTMGFILSEPQLLLLDNGGDYFLWVSWALAVVFAILRQRLHYPIVGAFVIPAIVLFMGCSSYLIHVEGASTVTEASGSSSNVAVALSLLHAVPALASVVSLALALVASVLFLLVERRLKQRKSELLTASGPNLQLLDRLNQYLVLVGFFAISFVILSGGLLAVSEQKPVFSFDTSVISGLLLWVLLAFILYVRMVLRWSPKQVSRITVLVTASFFLTIFAVLAVTGRLNHANIWL